MRGALLVALMMLAGCLSPGARDTPAADGVGTSASEDDALESACQRILPSRHGKGLQVEAAAEPQTIHPGDEAIVCAAAFNGGPAAFEFQACRNADWGLDDHGVAWGHDGFGSMTNLEGCASRAPARLGPGEAERWDQRLVVPRDLGPGPHSYEVDFYGSAAQVVFEVSLGSGTSAPSVALVLNRTQLKEGQSVLVHAFVNNTTQRSLRYWEGCGVNAIGFRAADASGDWSGDEARQGSCPIWDATLAPGDSVEDWWSWDGTGHEGRLRGNVTVRAAFESRFFEQESWVGQTTWAETTLMVE
ncbi:MAG TPA: hypothetical protein VM327_03375 [Candidatus Thermoplasmatota archaeon]|nr:hypothetical protein [Candidatus Thermoplasmatota archaeon]